MIRFWSRITHHVRQEQDDCSFVDLLKAPTYKSHAERLEKAKQHAWIRLWKTELEQVDYVGRKAIYSLDAQLQRLADNLSSIASPVKNPNKDQVNNAQCLASTALKEWDVSFEQLDQILTSSTPVISSSSFTKLALCHQQSQESLRESLQKHHLAYQQSIQTSIHAPHCSRLKTCMNQLIALHYNVCHYQAYLLTHIQWLAKMTMSESPSLNRQTVVVNQLKRRCRRILQMNHPTSTDYTCAICLDLLQEPITLNCDHTFCRVCIQRYFCQPCEQKRPPESFFSSIRHVIYCECYALDTWDRKAACPLCRQMFTAAMCYPNLQLNHYLSLYFPQEEQDKRELKSTLYSRIQRWSVRLTQQEGMDVAMLEVHNNMVSMARRSWVF